MGIRYTREGCVRSGSPLPVRPFWAFRRTRGLGPCLSWRQGLATGLHPSHVVSCQALRLLARQQCRGKQWCRVLATQSSQVCRPEPPLSVSTFGASSYEDQMRRDVLVSPYRSGPTLDQSQGAPINPTNQPCPGRELYLLLCLSSIFLHERLPPAKSSRSCGLTHCWQYRQRWPLTITIGPLRCSSHTPTRMLRGCSERRSALQPSMIQACPPSSEAILIKVQHTPAGNFDCKIQPRAFRTVRAALARLDMTRCGSGLEARDVRWRRHKDTPPPPPPPPRASKRQPQQLFSRPRT